MSGTSMFETRIKVGIFTAVGLLSIGLATVLVNDKPYWWRKCQLVHINVEDATGLKTKSPVRSLGLEIGYLSSVELTETHVNLGICITAPVEVLPATRAYLRGEGFLGDKFVELKPVRYLGGATASNGSGSSSSGVGNGTSGSPGSPGAPGQAPAQPSPAAPSTSVGSAVTRDVSAIFDLLLPSARAEDAAPAPAAGQPVAPAAAPAPAAPAPTIRRARPKGDPAERQIPVGESSQDMANVVNRVDSLVNEMTSLTNNLKQVMNPEEMRDTMRRLNRTLENASRTLSPESGLNQTAQRTLAKLEDAVEQLRDMITRVNQGEGSVGMVLNDPTYAEELRQAIKNVNQLLGKVSQVRFVVDIGGEKINGYGSGRGWFRLAIWPEKDRYYLVGISVDPRGRRTETLTTTTVGGISTTQDTVMNEQTGVLLTGMLGKVFFTRIDLSIGALNGDGDISFNFLVGPNSARDMFQLRADVYSRSGSTTSVDLRATLTFKPWDAVYVKAGIESINQVNGNVPYVYGAGISFDDEHIKLLFALR